MPSVLNRRAISVIYAPMTARRSRIRVGTVILAAGLLAVLGYSKVKVEANKNIDLSKYKTYQWLPPRVLTKSGISENDDTIAPLIKASVNRELARRNLTEVSSGGELQISTWALSESVPHVDALIFPGGAVAGAGVDVSGAVAPVATVGRYNKKGTLVVNLIDAATKSSAWAAVATDSGGNPSKLGGRIDRAVSDMFKKYPVKPGGKGN